MKHVLVRSAVEQKRLRGIRRTHLRYDEFLGQVQHRARLGSHAEAERATHATLETLAERLAGGEAHDLAAQLSPELARSLEAPDAGIGAKLTLNEFFELVSEREGVDLEDSTLHARVVIGVLTEAVSLGEIKDVRVQLPAAFAQLFNVENESDLPQILCLKGRTPRDVEKKTEKEIETTNYRPYPEADDAVVFPTLADSELAVLAALGTRRPVAVGEYLYREGDITYDFYVILSGAVEVAVRSDGEERIIARQGPGRFLGELNLLTGERVYLSAHIVEPGEVLVVPRAALQHVIATNPGLSDTILAAFLARRRGLLNRASASLRVVGSRFSPELLRIREFLARNRIPHEWLDPERDTTVERLLREFAITPGELPVVIASGSVLRRL